MVLNMTWRVVSIIIADTDCVLNALLTPLGRVAESCTNCLALGALLASALVLCRLPVFGPWQPFRRYPVATHRRVSFSGILRQRRARPVLAEHRGGWCRSSGRVMADAEVLARQPDGTI